MRHLQGHQTLQILDALEWLNQVGVQVEHLQFGTTKVLNGLDAVEREVQFEKFWQFMQVFDEGELVVIQIQFLQVFAVRDVLRDFINIPFP